MRSFLVSVVILLAGGFVCPSQSYGLDGGVISAIESDITDRICSAQHREWLLCFHEDPSYCREIAEKFVRPCLDKQLGGVTHQFSVDEVGELGAKIIECFNTTFAQQHPAGKKDTPECRMQPEHLQ